MELNGMEQALYVGVKESEIAIKIALYVHKSVTGLYHLVFGRGKKYEQHWQC